MKFELEEDHSFVVVDKNLFKTILEKNLVLPVFEDDEGDGVWGYGHYDSKVFAGIVNLYDRYLTGGREWPKYKAKDVKHSLAVAYRHNNALDDDYFRFQPIKHEDIPHYGSTSFFYFPLTWVSR